MDDVGKLAVAGVNFEHKNLEPVDIMHRDQGFKHGELAFFFGSAHAGLNAPAQRTDNVYDLHGARNEPRFETNNPQDDKAEGHIPYLHLINGDVQPDQLTQAEHHDLPLDHADHAEDSLTGIVLNYNHRNDVKPGYATEEERDQSSLLMGQNRRFNVEPNANKKAEQRFYEVMQINRLNLEFSQRMRELDRQIQELHRQIAVMDALGKKMDQNIANGTVIDVNTKEGRLALEDYKKSLEDSASELDITKYIDERGILDQVRLREDQKKEHEARQAQADQLIKDQEALKKAHGEPVQKADTVAYAATALENSDQRRIEQSREAAALPNQDLGSMLAGMGVSVPASLAAATPTSTTPTFAASAAQQETTRVVASASTSPPAPPAAPLSETFAGGDRALGSYATSADGSEVSIIASSFNIKANDVAAQTPETAAAPAEGILLAATTQQSTATANSLTRRI